MDTGRNKNDFVRCKEKVQQRKP